MSYDQSSIGIGGALWASGIGMVIASYISIGNIVKHKRNIKYPAAQDPLMVILSIPMLVGWPSWAILLVGETLGFLEFAEDVAKGLGVVCFNYYAIRIIGWEDSGSGFVFNASKVEKTLREQGEIVHPCKCCCSNIVIDSEETARNFIKRITVAGLQYLIVISCILVLSIIAYSATDQENLEYAYVDIDSAYLWVSVIKTFSMIYAVYNMILFFRAAAQFEDDTGFEMRNKFWSVKIAFLLTQIQSTLIGLIASTGAIADNDEFDTEDITLFTLHLLICTEMSILAFAQYVVFPVSDYESVPQIKKS